MPEFHPHFRELAKAHPTPKSVQSFIKSLRYNEEAGGLSIRSAIEAVKAGCAHCLEASFVAAAILEVRGYPPLILDLESKDGLDHVVYLFRENSFWGTIGRSREDGLEGRAPVYRSIRDLAWSYFDPYIDKTGRLRAYQVVNLDETKSNWRTSPRNVWKAESYLLSIPHRKLVSSQARYERYLKKYLRGEKLTPHPHWW
jgi:hypothetical protein